MTLLTIRCTKRYAVRQDVSLKYLNGGAASGLLIELTQEGCRISSLDRNDFRSGDPIVLDLDIRSLNGKVRWSSPSVIGVRFDEPLFVGELVDLISHNKAHLATP